MSKNNFSKIYIVSAEVTAKQGSEMWGDAIGGFLFCVVPKEDAEEAAKFARIALEEDNYAVNKIEEVIKFKNMAWETNEVENEYKQLAIEAIRTKDVVYGPFYTWETEDD